jgi:hypothetical protein
MNLIPKEPKLRGEKSDSMIKKNRVISLSKKKRGNNKSQEGRG